MSFQSRVVSVHDQTKRPYFYATTERLEPYVMKGGLKARHALGEKAGVHTGLTLFSNAELAVEHARVSFKGKEAIVLIEVDPLAVKLPNDMGLRGQRGAPLGGFRPTDGIPPSALRATRSFSAVREHEDTGIALRR